jgi:hypothetical protein
VSQFRGAGCQPAKDVDGRLATCPTKLLHDLDVGSIDKPSTEW